MKFRYILLIWVVLVAMLRPLMLRADQWCGPTQVCQEGAHRDPVRIVACEMCQYVPFCCDTLDNDVWDKYTCQGVMGGCGFDYTNGSCNINPINHSCADNWTGGISTYDCCTPCTPNCPGNTCGDDGCGGKCVCDPGYSCNGASVCVSTGCTCTAPEGVGLSWPANNTSYVNYNSSLTLEAIGISNWGQECGGTGRTYSMCWGTNPADPCNGGAQVPLLTMPSWSFTFNSLGTYYWDFWAVNGCGSTGPVSPIWRFDNNSSVTPANCALSAGNYVAYTGGVFVGTTATIFDIGMSGNAQSTSGNNLRLIMEDISFTTPVVNYQTQISPLTRMWNGSGLYQYYFDGSSLPSTTNDVSNNTPVNIKEAGNYYIHCDVARNPNGCSGNPRCTYNGGADTCSFTSCAGPVNAPGVDSLKMCITNESCATNCGQVVGCGLADCPKTETA